MNVGFLMENIKAKKARLFFLQPESMKTENILKRKTEKFVNHRYPGF